MLIKSLTASETLPLAANIVAAYVSQNKVSGKELPALLQSVHEAVCALASGQSSAVDPKGPAVPLDQSVTDEYIVCLEDGKRMRTLKRYLMRSYGLTPDEYKKKWNLPANYPMSALGYQRERSAIAKKSGLGKKGTGRGRRGTVGQKKIDETSPTSKAPEKMIAHHHEGRRIIPVLT